MTALTERQLHLTGNDLAVDVREHGIDPIRKILHRKYVIRPDEIPENYWKIQRRSILYAMMEENSSRKIE